MPFAPGWEDEYEEFIVDCMSEHDIPGVSVAVSRNGRSIYSRGFGFADPVEGIEATGDTLYELASVGKSMAALAIMMLEERGGLSTGDPVAHHLEDFRIGGTSRWDSKAVTLEHLMSHTSGLPPTAALRYATRDSLDNSVVDAMRRSGDWDSWIEGPDIRSSDDLIAYLSGTDIRPLGRPGEFFSYSNDGYALLGAVIERVDGRSFARFARDEILQPLGMERTTFHPDPRGEPDVAASFTRQGDGDPIRFTTWEHSPPMTAAGFVRSSAKEMMRFGQMLLNRGSFDGHRLVSPASIDRMIAPRVPISPEAHYGLALTRRRTADGATIVEHGGGGMGVRTNFGLIPEMGVSIMLMTNAAWAPAGNLWFALANALSGMDVRTPRFCRPKVEIRASILDRWRGEYESDEGHRLEVIVKDGRPQLTMQGSELTLDPSGPASAVFTFGGELNEINFIPGPDGEIAAAFIGHRMVEKLTGSVSMDGQISMWRRGE